ncbi:MAG: response regulator [Oscillospiraceae bacterium]|nr:response regulator [Oscillospiraceae bacterium]
MKTMLIVDDSAYSRTQIRLSVRRLPVEVVGEAESGNEGVEKYKELKPDIITLDLAMCDGDGLEAIKGIMKINPNAVIIVISSIGGQDIIAEEAVSLGAKKVFDKPFDGAKFAEYVKEIVS